ncbi:hypothetical protein GOV09_05350 [Candidatus Woesearchaeota archaeon]|nr:hypothetical protein [Candidatus Woesearchaeota archaeon]
MKQYLALVVLILVACTPQALCNAPYFEYKTGECCLDQDGNNICDSDENVVEKVIEVKQEEILYDIDVARNNALDAAKEYVRSNRIGISPSFTFLEEEIKEETYTGVYHIKYLENLNDFNTGYVKTNYDLVDEKVISVIFAHELSGLE